MLNLFQHPSGGLLPGIREKIAAVCLIHPLQIAAR
jgi:hypothetical protein